MDLLTLVLFICGFVGLIGGADLLVRGAGRLAAALGVSPLVIGLTVVAFGTSSPELAVGVMSVFSGKSALAAGNIVGSNICNLLLILGLAALAAPLPVSRRVIRVELPLVIGVSLLFWALALDGLVGRLDGILLAAGVVVFTVVSIRRSRRQQREAPPIAAFLADGQAPSAPSLSRAILQAAGGLVLLAVGSRWLVAGAIVAARELGVDELVIGLTVVAVGTSLPEIATAVTAALRGQGDLALGGVLGSNLFNILAVMGFTAAVAPDGVAVASDALQFHIPVMVIVAAVCLPVFYTGLVINRPEGLVMVFYYAAYTLYMVLAAADHGWLPDLRAAMTHFVIPATGLFLAADAIRCFHARRAGRTKR